MLGFMGIGPQELIIIGAIACLLILPAIAVIAVLIIVLSSNAKKD